MKTKTVTVVVDRPPDFSTAEKLRMAVGLTLEDGNKVSLLFIDDGVYSMDGIVMENHPAKMEIDKSLETLGMMGAELTAHFPSMGHSDMSGQTHNVKTLDDEEVARLLAESNTVIT